MGKISFPMTFISWYNRQNLVNNPNKSRNLPKNTCATVSLKILDVRKNKLDKRSNNASYSLPVIPGSTITIGLVSGLL